MVLMSHFLRLIWLIWAARLGAEPMSRLLRGGGGAYDAIHARAATGDVVTAFLAIAVVVLTFGRATPWRWALVVLSACWAIYFALSLVAGDEGSFVPTRLEPLVGLMISALTLWWARGRLRKDGEAAAVSR
jgi:hypothetical protein